MVIMKIGHAQEVKGKDKQQRKITGEMGVRSKVFTKNLTVKPRSAAAWRL